MLCLPVFIILLLLSPSAPSVDAHPKTKNDVRLDILNDVAKRIDLRPGCCARLICCPGR
uniref:Conotoxin n=1 Tax=Conus lividus TaxID=89426 RepID=S4UKK9_CONLI|nr:T superfamily conotoxin Lv5.6 precursor [Conus lividus]